MLEKIGSWLSRLKLESLPNRVVLEGGGKAGNAPELFVFRKEKKSLVLALPRSETQWISYHIPYSWIPLLMDCQGLQGCR